MAKHDDDKEAQPDDEQVASKEGGNEEPEDDAKPKRRRKRKRKKRTEPTDETQQEEQADADQVDEDQEQPAAAPGDDKKTREVNRTVFLEGLPFSGSEDDVREFLRENGGFTADDIEDIRLPVWQDSGRLRGYGHVVFGNEKCRQKALTLDGKCYLGNRYVTIRAAQAPKAVGNNSTDPAQNPSRTLILNNLSYDAREEDVDAVLREYGTIVEGGIRIVRHAHTGRSKGFCYVEFARQDVAMKVVQDSVSSSNSRSGLVICSRPCRVDYDHGRVRGSFRTADRKLWHKEFNNNSSSSSHQFEQSNDRKKRRS